MSLLISEKKEASLCQPKMSLNGVLIPPETHFIQRSQIKLAKYYSGSAFNSHLVFAQSKSSIYQVRCWNIFISICQFQFLLKAGHDLTVLLFLLSLSGPLLSTPES